MKYELPQLTYAYAALEPYIDVRTMEIHHGKHHATYVANLNDVLASQEGLESVSLKEMLKNLEVVPQEIRTAVRNNGGGHFAHSLFWEIMTPNAESEPIGELARAINAGFGDFTTFKVIFTKAATTHFGSGWVWLVVGPLEKLQIVSTSGHDTPLEKGLKPIMVLDVWEHAYYLKYQNRRAEYIGAWWNVVDWSAVAQKFLERG